MCQYIRKYYVSVVLIKSHLAHPSHDGQRVGAQELGIANFLVNDAVENFLLVVPRKRRLCTEPQTCHTQVDLPRLHVRLSL